MQNTLGKDNPGYSILKFNDGPLCEIPLKDIVIEELTEGCKVTMSQDTTAIFKLIKDSILRIEDRAKALTEKVQNSTLELAPPHGGAYAAIIEAFNVKILNWSDIMNYLPVTLLRQGSSSATPIKICSKEIDLSSAENIFVATA